MKITTAVLTIQQINEIIDSIVIFFHENKREEVIVYYGWNCNTEELYKDMRVSTSEIKTFINKSEKNGIYKLGESDIYISDIKGVFEFQLCHESDVHFSSKNTDMVEKIEKDWGEKYQIYR